MSGHMQYIPGQWQRTEGGGWERDIIPVPTIYSPSEREAMRAHNLRLLKEYKGAVVTLEYRYGAPILTPHATVLDALDRMAHNSEYGEAMYVALRVGETIVDGDRLSRLVSWRIHRNYRD